MGGGGGGAHGGWGTQRGCWPGCPGSGNLLPQPPPPSTPDFSALASGCAGSSTAVCKNACSGRRGRKERGLIHIEHHCARAWQWFRCFSIIFTRGGCGQGTEGKVRPRCELRFGCLRSPGASYHPWAPQPHLPHHRARGGSRSMVGRGQAAPCPWAQQARAQRGS